MIVAVVVISPIDDHVGIRPRKPGDGGIPSAKVKGNRVCFGLLKA